METTFTTAEPRHYEAIAESDAWRRAFPSVDWSAVDAEWAAVEFRALMESAR